MGAVIGIIYLGVVALMIASMWKVYVKAGKPGWAAIVPIYNLIVLLDIVKKPVWWIALFLIPIANVIVLFLVFFAVAKAFGKGGGFACGLIFLGFVFWPMLAFGDAQYQGAATPAAA